ncbi:MAG: Flp pilus assembly protein CpaB [Proteobacteria bacterium]|jgi:pilus assembly protein CpaB|nr:Flp pilus assembly protein CpaB [Pseudomonadota bacterium]
MAGSVGGPLRAIVFMIVSVVAGGSVLVVLFQLFGNYQERIAEAQKPEDTVMVIVSTRDLHQGVAIREEDIMMVEIPPRFLGEGTFLSPEFVVGRIPRERILANEFIRGERLSDPEQGVGLNAIIPRGMRAISMSISGPAAVGGFLNPGNYVDILLTSGDRTITKMQAMFVLAVNSRMRGESSDEATRKRGKQSGNVIFLVTAKQAEEITDWSRSGSLSFALRSDLDVKPIVTSGADMDALLGIIKKKSVPRRVVQPQPTPDHTSTVRFIMGQDVQDRALIRGRDDDEEEEEE